MLQPATTTVSTAPVATKARAAYLALEARFHRLYALRQGGEMLHWDAATMMPEGGAGARAEQLAALEVVCHELLTDPRVGDLLDVAGEEAAAEPLDEWQRANLREMRRQWRHATAVPADLVEALSRSTRRCEMLWRKARPASDFAMARPALEELLGLVRQQAAAKAEALGLSLYDALLDLYEPGLGAARIEEVFGDLERFLKGFLGQVLERQAGQPAPVLPEGPFAKPVQEDLARRLMASVGFDFSGGRLDESLHPFCGGTPDDTRITTRYEEGDFTKAIMGVLHETGHALYERGLPAEWRLQPVGQARGMALHESQSLLIEMQAGRSDAFVAHLAGLARETFAGRGAAWEVDNLRRLYRRVRPDFIRVDADEVTYPAHVILRFRLERAMIAGDLAVPDLPGAWNDGLKDLLGIEPPDDRRGCLQDIHWYDGAWGYFPTYTLGAMTAAQLFAAIEEQQPAAVEALGRGDFSGLVGWVAERVHAKASLLDLDAVLLEATGKPLDPGIFEAHLERRYLAA